MIYDPTLTVYISICAASPHVDSDPGVPGVACCPAPLGGLGGSEGARDPLLGNGGLHQGALWPHP